MHATGLVASSGRLRSAAGFVTAVLRAVTWRSVIATQALALLIALFTWLETSGWRAQHGGLSGFIAQMLAAVFVMLAGLAGNEAVRRGWPVWRAFVVALLSAASATAVAQPAVYDWLGIAGSGARLLQGLNTIFDVGVYWGMVLMVYLNRQSAARTLAGVRAVELERARAESRLIASRLAAAEAQIDPGSVLKRLAEVRDLYAAGQPGAEPKLEELIADLRRRVVSGVAEAAARAGEARP